MQKEKRITLNAEKRKVIADVFQDHFESNSKFKKAWSDAIKKLSNKKFVRLIQPEVVWSSLE